MDLHLTFLRDGRLVTCSLSLHRPAISFVPLIFHRYPLTRTFHIVKHITGIAQNVVGDFLSPTIPRNDTDSCDFHCSISIKEAFPFQVFSICEEIIVIINCVPWSYFLDRKSLFLCSSPAHMLACPHTVFDLFVPHHYFLQIWSNSGWICIDFSIFRRIEFFCWQIPSQIFVKNSTMSGKLTVTDQSLASDRPWFLSSSSYFSVRENI